MKTLILVIASVSGCAALLLLAIYLGPSGYNNATVIKRILIGGVASFALILAIFITVWIVLLYRLLRARRFLKNSMKAISDRAMAAFIHVTIDRQSTLSDIQPVRKRNPQ
jgi:hypothetical protein